MTKTKILRMMVRVKQKRQAILATWVTAVLLVMFQNCGAKQSSTTSLPAAVTNPNEPSLTAPSYSFTFASAVGAAAQDFVITNSAAGQAMNLSVTASLSSAAFSVTKNTCNGAGLSTNSQCTITVAYRNCVATAQSGVIYLAYSDSAGTALAPLNFYVYGPAGNPAGCVAISPGGNGTLVNPGNQVLVGLPVSWITPTPGPSASPFPAYTLYRKYSGNLHMLTYDPAEGSFAGWYPEGPVSMGFVSQYDPTMVPLFRCNLNSKPYLTTKMNCEGQANATLMKLIGWAHATQNGSEVPLYRFRNDATGDHLDTLSLSEGANAGYILDGITAYVPLSGGAYTPSSPVPSKLISIYRKHWNRGGFMSTIDAGEGGASATLNGPIGKIYTSNDGSGLLPLYRCSGDGAGSNFIPFHHLTTNDVTCEGISGLTGESIMGWVHGTQQTGEIPLYRFRRSDGDYLDTTDLTDGTTHGYVYQKILGYVVKP